VRSVMLLAARPFKKKDAPYLKEAPQY